MKDHRRTEMANSFDLYRWRGLWHDDERVHLEVAGGIGDALCVTLHLPQSRPGASEHP